MGEERIRGSINVPLNEEGRKEAERLAKLVEQMGCLDEIHSSALDRAKVTAEKVAEASGIKNHATAKLNPWHLGKFEGEEVTNDLARELEDYVKHPDRVPPEGGKESQPPESFNSFKERVLATLNQLAAKAQAQKNKIGAVGHFRTMRLWEAYVAAGGKKSLKLDHAKMCSPPKPDEHTGHLMQISNLAGKKIFKELKPGKSLAPGLYLMRHGKTPWNRK